MLLVAFVQRYVMLSERWQLLWARTVSVGAFMLPVCVYLATHYGLGAAAFSGSVRRGCAGRSVRHGLWNDSPYRCGGCIVKREYSMNAWPQRLTLMGLLLIFTGFVFALFFSWSVDHQPRLVSHDAYHAAFRGNRFRRQWRQ